MIERISHSQRDRMHNSCSPEMYILTVRVKATAPFDANEKLLSSVSYFGIYLLRLSHSHRSKCSTMLMIIRLPFLILIGILQPRDAWVVVVKQRSHQHPLDTLRTFVATDTTSTPTRCIPLHSQSISRNEMLQRTLLMHMTNTPFNDQDDLEFDNSGMEEECNNEEECEIDWSRMQPIDSTSLLNNSNNNDNIIKNEVSIPSSISQTIQEQLERQFASSMSDPKDTIVPGTSLAPNSIPASERHGDSTHTTTTTSLRQRLEMQWQLASHEEECDVYRPDTCGGQRCPTCHGQGTDTCRFCHGAGQLPMRAVHDDGTIDHIQLTCLVCNAAGHETCKSCQGTGWIADWTQNKGVVRV